MDEEEIVRRDRPVDFELGQIELDQDASAFADMKRELVHFQPSGDQQERDDLVMAFTMAAWQAVKDVTALLAER